MVVVLKGEGIAIGNSAVTSQRFYTGFYDSTQLWAGAGGASKRDINSNATSDSYHIFQFGNHSGNTQTLRFDGQTLLNTSYSGSTQTNTTFIVGGGGGNPNVYLTGNMAEVLVFDRQLTDQRKKSIGYLPHQKWGIQLNSDSDGDGVSDAKEIMAGTSALSADSVPNMPVVPSEVETFVINGDAEVMVFKYDANNDNGQGQTEYTIDFPENVIADVLIVGGGGGGFFGGGGGGGGVLFTSGIELNGSHTIRVGKGGLGKIMNSTVNNIENGDNGVSMLINRWR